MDRVETLRAVLEDEARVCGALNGVLRREQEAMVGLEPRAILACLRERHGLQEELGRLANRRREVVSELVSELAASAGTETSLGALLGDLPESARNALRPRLGALRRALLETRTLERQNAALARASAATVSDLLTALRSVAPGVRYGADARVDAPATPERLGRRA